MMIRTVMAALISSSCLISATQANAGDLPQQWTKSCGWFESLRFGTTDFVNAEARWHVSTRDGHMARGQWPVFSGQEWRELGREYIPGYGEVSYGYGCVCLQAKMDRRHHLITVMKKAIAHPFAVCRRENALTTIEGQLASH